MTPALSNGTSTPIWHNPAPGSVLEIHVGTSSQIALDFSNHAPFVASFHLQVEGLPEGDWVQGASEADSMRVAAHGDGSLRLTLTPPASEVENRYDVLLSLVCDGQTVGQTPFTISITAIAVPDASLPVTPPTESVSPVATTTVAETIAGGSDPNAIPATPFDAWQATNVPLVNLRRQRNGATSSDQDDDDSLSSVKEEPDEPSVLDPAEGETLPLRPGETLLVRFAFTNTSERACTYVIDEDRSLPVGWLTMVQDEINITRDESDELSLRLTPPANAKPGLYPFGVNMGLEGDALTARMLVLQVPAMPAVRLRVKHSVLRFPWRQRGVEFVLTAETMGNSDTAFRVFAQTPRTQHERTSASPASPKTVDALPSSTVTSSPSTAPKRQEPTPESVEENYNAVHEVGKWRYDFDRELDTLRSLTPRRPPKARQIHLRLERQGTWWWGMRETRHLQVTAVPVTDPTNGGQTENTVQLTAVRWRPYPFASQLLLPLLVLPFLLLGKASNLDLTTRNFQGKDGTRYVVAQPSRGTRDVHATLRWDAPFFSLQRLRAITYEPRYARSPQELTTRFAIGQKSIDRIYQVQRPWDGDGPQIKVKYVAARSDTPLKITHYGRPVRLYNAPDGSVVSEPLLIPISGSPPLVSGSFPLTLSNQAEEDYALNYWIVRRPNTAFFVRDLNDEGSLTSFNRYGPSAVKAFSIARGMDGVVGEEGELDLVTTDLSHPMVRLRLRLVPNRRKSNSTSVSVLSSPGDPLPDNTVASNSGAPSVEPKAEDSAQGEPAQRRLTRATPQDTGETNAP